MNNPFPPLYKLSSKGKIQIWQIIVEGNTFYTVAGQKDGKMTTAVPTICEGKNVGKANETSGAQQALNEAQSKHDAKLNKEHYVDDESKLGDAPKFTKVMLALDYKDEKDGLDFKEGVYAQCKLNGARCVAEAHGLFSRKGKEWLCSPHIQKALKPLFDKYPGLKFDGEFFNETLRQNLGAMISLVKKKKPTPEQFAESEKIVQYHIYDLISDGTPNFDKKPYTQRLARLIELLTELGHIDQTVVKYIHPIKTEQVQSHKEIDDLLKKFEDEGHEGLIVRMDRAYKGGSSRSKHLLKYKTWVDAEFKIVGAVEGKGNCAGMIGAFNFVDKDGRTFDAQPIGSHEYWTQMWNDLPQLIGTMATVKYKELSPIKEDGTGGVPYFGKVTAVRNYE